MKSRKFLGLMAFVACCLIAVSFNAEAQQWVCGPGGCYQVGGVQSSYGYSAPPVTYAAPSYGYAAQPVYYGGFAADASSCSGGGGYSAAYAAPAYSSCGGGGGGGYSAGYGAGYSSCGGGGGGYSYAPAYGYAAPQRGFGFGFRW